MASHPSAPSCRRSSLAGGSRGRSPAKAWPRPTCLASGWPVFLSSRWPQWFGCSAAANHRAMKSERPNAEQKKSTSIMLTRLHNKHLCALALVSLGFAAAASGEQIIFSAMGCGPYTPPDKPAVAFYVRQENRERISEFMVHLGDVFKMPVVQRPQPAPGVIDPPGPDHMPSESEYHWTADLLTLSNTIPTWIVM